MIEQFLKYLRYQKRVSPHTVIAYQGDLEEFSDFLLKTYPGITVDKAGYGEIRSWLIALVDAGLKPTSVNRKMASLRSLYKFLMKEGLLKRSPMMKIKALKSEKRLPTFVRETEMQNLLDGIEFSRDFPGLRNQLILELFYSTGMRLSELLQLKDSRVDLHARTIKVLGKRNKERVIPFPDSLVSLIKDYRKARNKEVNAATKDLLFLTDQGSACYPMMIYRMVKKYLTENTSVEKRSPHVLRHTYATHLLNKGAEINAVKDLLGHSNLAATQVYTHNSIEKIKKAFDQAHPKA